MQNTVSWPVLNRAFTVAKKFDLLSRAANRGPTCYNCSDSNRLCRAAQYIHCLWYDFVGLLYKEIKKFSDVHIESMEFYRRPYCQWTARVTRPHTALYKGGSC